MTDTAMRAAFEAAMGDVLKADQGKFALSRAHDAEQSYTFLATKLAWNAWQLATPAPTAPVEHVSAPITIKELIKSVQAGDKWKVAAPAASSDRKVVGYKMVHERPGSDIGFAWTLKQAAEMFGPNWTAIPLYE